MAQVNARREETAGAKGGRSAAFWLRAAGHGLASVALVGAWLTLAYWQTGELVGWRPVDEACRVTVGDEGVLLVLLFSGSAAAVAGIVALGRDCSRSLRWTLPVELAVGLSALGLALGVIVTLAFGSPIESPKEFLWLVATITAAGAPSLSILATSIFLRVAPAGHVRRTLVVALLTALCPLVLASALDFAWSISACLTG